MKRQHSLYETICILGTATIIALAIFGSGCAKPTGIKVGGKDSIVDNMKNELAISKKEEVDNSTKTQGSHSIMNELSPDLIKDVLKEIKSMAILIVGLPFLTLLLVGIIYILSSERRFKIAQQALLEAIKH